KCRLKVNSVEYLGHVISRDGFKPKVSLVDAVMNASAPKNKDELRSFLGLAEFMAKYVKKFSKVSADLRELLRNKVPFEWNECHDKAFKEIKTAIINAPYLCNFDHRRKTFLTTDASKLGLGATLSQIIDGEERIVAFASRTLNKAEANYSVIEREALACFWAVKHLTFLLWGAQFTLRTDHKPLVYIFSTKGFNNSTPRIARWILALQNFCFSVVYLPGNKNCAADFLSRTPLDCTENFDALEYPILAVDLPSISDEEWNSASQQDNSLALLRKKAREGWPRNKKDVEDIIKAYW
ncbi:hypothetical protein NDU88_004654, partial [Pleurodeles waltl]